MHQTYLCLCVVFASVDALYPFLPTNLAPACRPLKAHNHPESHPDEDYQDDDKDSDENIKFLFHSVLSVFHIPFVELFHTLLYLYLVSPSETMELVHVD